MTSLDELRDRYHRALAAFIQGNATPVLDLWSSGDDTTLANPFGPPVRGLEAVREAGERAASQVTDGEAFTVENVSTLHDLGSGLRRGYPPFQGKDGRLRRTGARLPTRHDRVPTRG
jgi:hypothetical protein